MNVYDQRKTCEKVLCLAASCDMSDKELAEEIHISPQAVSKWRCYNSAPSIDNLCIMTGIFAVPLNEIVVIKTI